MRALVVYESMFGTTRELSEAIAAGLKRSLDVRLCRADEVQTEDASAAELLVAGGPAHSQSSATPASRQEAAVWGEDPATGLRVDLTEMTTGPREWFDELESVPGLFAAFDARTDIPKLLTGAASVRIGRELRLRGSTPVVPPESFLLTRSGGLKSGEAERARWWGEQVAEAARRARPRTTTETST
ncbi:hypothetical protein ACFFGH_12820 [Lysobacter korlensis]|uniref:Flavodoxin-like domain-containing protein n=1 Tax=Lysobacter korlensis TaxID=553636 RepID=A0ABV6RP17_9GAMM